MIGQTSVLLQRRDIDKVIDDPDTPQQLREQLQTVQLLRRFAGDELALPVEAAFTTYADTERRFVVWNVFNGYSVSLMLIEVSCLVVNSSVVLNLVMLVSMGILMVLMNCWYCLSLVMVFDQATKSKHTIDDDYWTASAH